ncbi:hypothetical protein HU144_07270 [Brevibacterium sp. UCMA 11752]|nr:hypothetical protein [Brevibacterium sp. UCMA 11752]
MHDAIADIRPGDVVVIEDSAETERALIGELIVERIRDAGGSYRHGPGRHQVPTSIGEVVCHPGDCIAADEDRVMVLPDLQAESILNGGLAKLDAEPSRARPER